MNRHFERVHGTEMEWAGIVSKPHNNQLTQLNNYELVNAMTDYFTKSQIKMCGDWRNAYLENGARFYPDTGEHREYATPEDTSFIGTLANELAGEKIMNGIADSYQELNGNKVQFLNRCIDDDLSTSGYHASYCTDLEAVTSKDSQGTIDRNRIKIFGSFAASRSVLFGAGMVLPIYGFKIAQKAFMTQDAYAVNTTSMKPVVNLRNERLADRQRFARIHDISGDPNMSPWATRVKLGAASLVLRLVEIGYEDTRLQLDDILNKVSHKTANDQTLTVRHKLEDGSSATALDIQARLSAAVRSQVENGSIAINKEEAWTLDEWERTIADLQQNPKLTYDRVEWVMKREALERFRVRNGHQWDSQIMRFKDRQFSDISRDGIGVALRETIWSSYMPERQLIHDRIKNPPQSTRAAIRGDFIKQLHSRFKDLAYVTWQEIGIGNNKIPIGNPYQNYSKDADNLHKLTKDVSLLS